MPSSSEPTWHRLRSISPRHRPWSGSRRSFASGLPRLNGGPGCRRIRANLPLKKLCWSRTPQGAPPDVQYAVFTGNAVHGMLESAYPPSYRRSAFSVVLHRTHLTYRGQPPVLKGLECRYVCLLTIGGRSWHSGTSWAGRRHQGNSLGRETPWM